MGSETETESRQIMIWVRFERGRSESSAYYMRKRKSKQMSLLSVRTETRIPKSSSVVFYHP